ncbi:MAG: hypothetical protein AB7W16_13105 [Candidatus Obscuribacterales bacterium]
MKHLAVIILTTIFLVFISSTVKSEPVEKLTRAEAYNWLVAGKAKLVKLWTGEIERNNEVAGLIKLLDLDASMEPVVFGTLMDELDIEIVRMGLSESVIANRCTMEVDSPFRKLVLKSKKTEKPDWRELSYQYHVKVKTLFGRYLKFKIWNERSVEKYPERDQRVRECLDDLIELCGVKSVEVLKSPHHNEKLKSPFPDS